MGNPPQIIEKFCMRETPQRVLVKDRDRLPLGGLIELGRVDVIELAPIPGGFPRQLERMPFALALDAPDLGARFRHRQSEGHCAVLPNAARSAKYRLTSSDLITLRVGVIGMSCTTMRFSGHVNFANRRSVRNSFSPSKVNEPCSFRITKQQARSPKISSGTGAIATCCTAGWLASATSMSIGLNLMPPRLISSLVRPLSSTFPAASILARSPVRNQPSGVNAAAVASGFLA